MSAAFFNRLGANQRLPYHRRTSSRTFDSATLNGSRLSGTIGERTASCGTMAGEPQNSQFFATCFGSNSEIALQL